MSKKEEGPDQARSWAIALAACVVNALLSGISRTTGLFYVALIETYGVSRLQANLPFTVRNLVRNLAGPLVGAIGQRYGSRDVTIVGGVFASLGIILCTFAPNVIWIIILWGGIHGFGVALGNTLFQVTVTQYFQKYRATASGLALSGACFGAFLLPILLEYMLQNLGLSGTFLVTGGLIMHVLPASIMLKEPPWIRRIVEEKRNIPHVKITRKVSKQIQPMSMIQEEPKTTTEDLKNPCVSNLRKIPSSDALDRKRDEKESNCYGGPNGVDNPSFMASKMDLREKTIDQVQEEAIYRGRLRTFSLGEISISVPAPEHLQETSLYKGILKVCRDPMFYMISISLAAFSMAFDPPITVIVDYLMDKGLTGDVAKYFISVMSLGDLVGRLCFGWVTDRDYLSVPKFMMVVQVGLGVCTILFPLFNDFNTLMALIVMNGLISGATLVIFPILVGKYLQTVQSLAIGCMSFLTGLMTFAVPPLIGYFRDTVGSYDGMFYITGGLSLVTGFLWLLEPLLLRMRTKLKREESASIIISS